MNADFEIHIQSLEKRPNELQVIVEINGICYFAQCNPEGNDIEWSDDEDEGDKPPKHIAKAIKKLIPALVGLNDGYHNREKSNDDD